MSRRVTLSCWLAVASFAHGCGTPTPWCNYPCGDVPDGVSHAIATTDDTLFVLRGGGEWIDYVTSSGEEGVYIGYLATVGDDYYSYRRNLDHRGGSSTGVPVVEILNYEGYRVLADCLDLSNHTYRTGGTWRRVLSDSLSDRTSNHCEFEP